MLETLTMILSNPVFADAASEAERIANFLRKVIGPFLLLYIGIKAFSFFAQQQMMQMVQYLIIAIVVCVLFYTPDVMEKLAALFSNII